MWIVDALRPTPHPSHLSLDEALAWIERLKPKRAILTHMHVDLDYETLRRTLPPNVEPAYDGMAIELAGVRARTPDCRSASSRPFPCTIWFHNISYAN